MSSTIFYGGKIITMTNECPEAIMVEDGIIKYMGKRNEIFKLADTSTQHINLKNKCLAPGFIDGHSHITQYAMTFSTVDLSQCESFNDIIMHLQSYKIHNKIGKDKWIIGFGYDHNILTEKKHLSRKLLDKFFPLNPVVITHKSGHMGVVNSMALDVAEYDDDIDSDGYLEENDFFMLVSKIPEEKIEDRLRFFIKAQNEYLKNGFTTVQDGMLDDDSFELLKIAERNNFLLCDVVGYADIKKSRNLLNDNSEYNKRYKNKLKLQGYKIFLDGSPQGRTAWIKEPYKKVMPNDDENYNGYQALTNEELSEYIKIALSEETQLIAHCNGDAAIEQFVFGYENHTETRPVIIHSQLMPKALLPEIKEKGLMPSYFIAHTYYWGDVHIENLGNERASNISPAKTTSDYNIPYTFHQDTPVLPPNVIDTIWCATNRKTKNGIVLGENEKISIFEALKAVTINGAYQYFEENEKGSIEIGKKGDLVILSEDILSCEVEEIKKVKVIATFKDGETVYGNINDL